MQVQSYKTAIYCRLSREDGNEESQSIQSQKDILTKYVIEQGWSLVNIYADDGYSGTNFERPAFKRMVQDIELGLINMVITKDLSRLGRNYIQTGYYTEEYFPEHDVRYIALNDSFDTLKDDNDFAPFKNIINEWYAKDISKKVRFTLDNQAKNGAPRNTVFPIFGYQYNEKFERIPDPETASIVRRIFEEYAKCASTVKVAKLLTEEKIKLPKYYNAVKYNYNKDKVLNLPEEELYQWTPYGVRDILKRKEYLGTYITAQSTSKSFKLKKRCKHSENAHIFENRYEPLVTKELFDSVARLLERGRAGQIPFEENLYKNMIVCSKCGKPLKSHRWKNKNGVMRYRYHCYNKECGAKSVIYVEPLNIIIQNELQELKTIILSKEQEFLEFVSTFHQKGRNIQKNFTKDISKYENRCKELDYLIQKLFEQNTLGKIPESTYNTMMEKYAKERKLLEETIKTLTKEEIHEPSSKDYDTQAKTLLSLFMEYDFTNLTSSLIHQFIKLIQIEETGNKKEKIVHITYSYLDTIIKEFCQNETVSRNLC